MSERRWYTEPETFIAAAALVVSVSAVVVGLYETSLQRHHDRAEVWPHVEIATFTGDQGTTVTVEKHRHWSSGHQVCDGHGRRKAATQLAGSAALTGWERPRRTWGSKQSPIMEYAPATRCSSSPFNTAISRRTSGIRSGESASRSVMPPFSTNIGPCRLNTLVRKICGDRSRGVRRSRRARTSSTSAVRPRRSFL
jgi:hypothetical protein